MSLILNCESQFLFETISRLSECRIDSIIGRTPFVFVTTELLSSTVLVSDLPDGSPT